MKPFEGCAPFVGHVLPGKQAIVGLHRPLFRETNKAKVARSVNFESVASKIPKLRRVDYLIESTSSPDHIHAVEIHAFDQRVLIEKVAGTRALVRTLCPDAIDSITSWQVVLKGPAPRSDLIARFEATTKVTIAGRVLAMDRLK